MVLDISTQKMNEEEQHFLSKSFKPSKEPRTSNRIKDALLLLSAAVNVFIALVLWRYAFTFRCSDPNLGLWCMSTNLNVIHEIGG